MATAAQIENAARIFENPLEYPGLPKKKHPGVLLRVWHYPAFEPHCSWSVIEDRGQYFVRRIAWDHQASVISPEPETYGAEAPIEKAPVDALLTKLRSIEVPPYIPVAGIGLDGVRNGLEVGDYMASARLTWWCDPPRKWAAVRDWHGEAMKILDSHLPASTPHLRNAR